MVLINRFVYAIVSLNFHSCPTMLEPTVVEKGNVSETMACAASSMKLPACNMSVSGKRYFERE